MGGELNRCAGCSCTKEDKNTAKFDVAPYNASSSLTPNDKGETPFPNYNDTDNTNTKDLKSFIRNKSGLPEQIQLSPVQKLISSPIGEQSKSAQASHPHLLHYIRLQSVYRGISYRHYYPLLKEKQIEETNLMLKEMIEQYTKFNLKRAESLIGTKYDKNGWKNLYIQDKEDLFTYNDGLVFQTKILFLNGEHHSFYTGDVNLKNERHGYGVYLQNNGTKYEGHWVSNNFTGWGRYIDSEGTFYEGYFNNSLLNGKGIKRTLTGNNYIGDFLDNMRHGKGREETNEHTYEGEFDNDKKNGNGKLIYKLLKDTYEGEFKDNCITGIGFFTWANNDTYKGSFINGKMHGKGLYKWPDGGEYYGDYENNIKEGYGSFKWANGKVFEGQFHNGRPSGHGKLRTGIKEVDVEFKDGKLLNNLR